MIISHKFKYVYIGIPRTGSKSMNRWLMDHFAGEWVGYHHQWQVPADAQDYLIFTLVRNPYERQVSAWYHLPWSAPEAAAPKPTDQFAEVMQEVVPYKDGTRKIEGHNVPEAGMNQKAYVDKAGVALVLHFEHLPNCLKQLPFVDHNNVPPFPHIEERGQRPQQNFFDLFTMEDEKLVWAYAAEDFAAFGYRRFAVGLPVDVP